MCQTPLHGHRLRHHQRTPPTDNLTTILQQICHIAWSQCQSQTSRHVKMLKCGKFLSIDGEFVVQQVVELLWARPLWWCPLPVSVAGIRVVEFGPMRMTRVLQQRAVLKMLDSGGIWTYLQHIYIHTLMSIKRYFYFYDKFRKYDKTSIFFLLHLGTNCAAATSWKTYHLTLNLLP